ncbi:MAG: glycosyltransferase [Planctomycetes bacterium]|nr:glycosyltransferase [Planctomycetota bacterium]
MPELVSVVMPTYNQAGFIAQAIRSVLDQTYSKLELLVVDNHSDDGTAELVKGFMAEDPRVRHLLIRNDGVVAKSRNLGIREAKGDWVAFLDSDDYWFDEKLSRVLQCASEFPEAELICTDFLVRDMDTESEERGYAGPYTDYLDLLLRGNSLSTSDTVVKTGKALEAGLFSEDPRYVVNEDYEFWLRLSRCAKIHYLHEALSVYRVHGDNLSRGIRRQTDSELCVLEDHFRGLADRGILMALKCRARRSSVLRGASLRYVGIGEYGDSLNCAWRAMVAAPHSFKNWLLPPALAWGLLSKRLGRG